MVGLRFAQLQTLLWDPESKKVLYVNIFVWQTLRLADIQLDDYSARITVPKL